MESFAYKDVILWSLMFRICPSGTGGQRIAVANFLYLPLSAASIGCFYECLLLCCEVMFLHRMAWHSTALHCTALHFLPTFYNNCEDHLHLSLSNCTILFKCLLNSLQDCCSWEIQNWNFISCSLLVTSSNLPTGQSSWLSSKIFCGPVCLFVFQRLLKLLPDACECFCILQSFEF